MRDDAVVDKVYLAVLGSSGAQKKSAGMFPLHDVLEKQSGQGRPSSYGELEEKSIFIDYWPRFQS